MVVSDSDAIAEARRALGALLAAFRRRAGLKQQDLAPQTGYGRSTVANVETGRQGASGFFWQRCDKVLEAEGALLRAHEQLKSLVRQRDAAAAEIAIAHRPTGTNRPLPPLGPERPIGEGVAGAATLDTAGEIQQRTRATGASNIDEPRLSHIERVALQAIEQNERTPPPVLGPQVLRLRRHVDRLLGGQQLPRQRQRLFVAAAQLSGLLGAVALDLGLWQAARAYGAEAFELATWSGDANLQAWARATQSLIEYYSANYHDALAYAEDGQRLANNGPQCVRLALNGEARALARLRDQRGMEEAIQRGLEMSESTATPTEVSPSLALGPYCAARASANIATAYLVAGRPAMVHEHGSRAIHAFDAAGLCGPKALTRLDLATSFLVPGNVDTEQACHIATAALQVAGSDRFESVTQRAHEFLALADPLRTSSRLRDVADLVRARAEQRALDQ